MHMGLVESKVYTHEIYIYSSLVPGSREGPGDEAILFVVTFPDPTLSTREKGSGYGYNPWARERNLNVQSDSVSHR